jgi:hypothetical protein
MALFIMAILTTLKHVALCIMALLAMTILITRVASLLMKLLITDFTCKRLYF